MHLPCWRDIRVLHEGHDIPEMYQAAHQTCEFAVSSKYASVSQACNWEISLRPVPEATEIARLAPAAGMHDFHTLRVTLLR